MGLLVLYLALLGLGFVALVLLIRLQWTIQAARFKANGAPQQPLPSVTVCIPARNETHAMTECLERVLASDYEKLEIIVLDDSSADDTSVLIRSFAHSGVRFIEGSPLPDGWLGKNHALHELMRNASGQYILYLDVDTTIQPSSIAQLVSWLLRHKLSMVSVLPYREDGRRASVLFGSLRYFWTLVLRGTTPQVSAAAWLVERAELARLGGFVPYKDSVQPEAHIAAHIPQSSHSQLLLGDPELGFGFEKKWSSQVETSIRLLQPTLGGSLRTLSVACLLLFVAVLPWFGLIVGLVAHQLMLSVLAVLVLALFSMVALIYFHALWRHDWWIGAFHWPYVVLQEACLAVCSVVNYARGTVTWKGRPIKNPGIVEAAD